MIGTILSFGSDSRGQAYTLEAFVAAVLILGAIAFALQATAITPLTASTANERIEVQQQTIASDLLNSAKDSSSLSSTVLYWDTADRTFIGATPDGYMDGGPPTEFGNQLNATFTDQNIAFNVYITSRQRDNSGSREHTLVHQGQPSDNAVSAKETIVLYDTMALNDGSGRTLKDVESRLYIKDAAPNSTVYNIVDVRIVVWRM